MAATIIAKQSLNGIEILKTDTSPVSGGGLAAPIGSQANAVDGSGISYKVGAGDTDWISASGNITVVLSTTPASHTGDTIETVKYTASIPVNTYTTHDKITQEILASAIGTSGIKTIKTYINTTPDLSGTPILTSTYSTNNLGYSLLSSFFVDSNSSMKSYKPGNANSATYWGSSNASLGSFAINWTIQQYLVVTVQLAYSTDIIQLEGIFLNRSRK